jgi:uncharacterized Zn-binding protein involved in type VI secretion
MYTIALGYVKVTTAGIPVALSAVITAYNAALPAGAQTISAGEQVHKIEFWPLPTNTGFTYAGLDVSAPMSTGVVMNKATGVNVLKVIQIPAVGSGHSDFFCAASDANSVRIADYSVDVAVSGEGFAILAVKN